MIFLIFIFTTALFAQGSNDTINKIVEPKLSIDDGDGIMLSYAPSNMVMTNKFFGLKERLNSQHWQGYQGTARVAEPTFFEIAGFTEEAAKAGKYQSIRQNVFWTGTGLAILGALIGSIQFVKNDRKWSWNSEVIGVSLLGVGLAVDAVWLLSPPNRYSPGMALDAAGKYNQRE